jgi:putative ABC transport system ATP-binding protein
LPADRPRAKGGTPANGGPPAAGGAMVANGGAAATCAGVVKIYWTATGEVHALQSVDALFPGSAVTALVGPSGSGKSSLLRILGAMDVPTAGQVRVGGVDLAGLSRRRLRRVRRRLVGYVFQRPADNLVSYLTVAEHMRLAARLRGLGRKADREAGDILEALGIAGRRNHLPHQLSGGEQQRLAFAQAVLGAPSLVVADEPTAELDSVTGRALLGTVVELARQGTAFVVATHDPAAMGVADRTLYLRHGALHAESTADGGKAEPLAVIDQSGRIQLPPRALRLFPDRRATIRLEDGEVRILPP